MAQYAPLLSVDLAKLYLLSKFEGATPVYNFETELNVKAKWENVTGSRLGISYTCTSFRYTPAFIATR